MTALRFGEFRLDPISKQLWRGEQPVELNGIPFAVLCRMVERSTAAAADPSGGCLMTKQELRELFWRDVQVSEESLRTCMSSIRRALGDDSHQPRYIKTQSREGWRFVMPVESSSPPASSAPYSYGANYNPRWYVERPYEEREILGCIKYPGRPVVVYGPQYCGKSWLITRALESACQGKTGEPSARVIRINMRTLAQDHLGSLDEMLQELGRRMLDPDERAIEQTQAALSKFWSKEIDGKLKLKRLVRSQVLQPGQVLYLVLANVEHLAAWKFQATLFDMFRAWQEVEELASLRLIIETSIPPRLYALGGHSPLWTKARRIPVPGFDASQIAQMAALYRLRPSPGTCSQLGELVGGLAMLCQAALFHAAVFQQTLDEALNEYQPTARQFGAFKDHLEDIQHWVDYQEHAARRTPTEKVFSFKFLSDAARGVSLSKEEAWPAVRKGLLIETDERDVYRLGCRLYEDYFVASKP